jgi:hypothetical protein
LEIRGAINRERQVCVFIFFVSRLLEFGERKGGCGSSSLGDLVRLAIGAAARLGGARVVGLGVAGVGRLATLARLEGARIFVAGGGLGLVVRIVVGDVEGVLAAAVVALGLGVVVFVVAAVGEAGVVLLLSGWGASSGVGA